MSTAIAFIPVILTMILTILIYGAMGYLIFLSFKVLRRLIKALDIYISKNTLSPKTNSVGTSINVGTNRISLT